MSVCPSYIGARRLRVTRLDHCGRPVYGDCSTAVSSGFVSVEFEPEVEEGEDYTLRNAAGELCVSERGPDALQWINVSIEFCNVDPELWQIMNPTWKTVKNAKGEVTGFRIGEKFSDEQGFALEVWPKAAGQTALCDDDAPDDAQPNGYFLLPYVVGGAPEGWTLEDGTATFTLNGRTKAGSLWGRGPYNITHDANGDPSPLLEPIASGSNGDDSDPDHFHADIVTIAPPEASCGCQELEAMAPGAVDGQIDIDTDQPNRACFTVSGSPGRRVTIDWGDDSEEVTSRVGREECHLYTEEGTYTITVSDVDDADKSNTYEVTIDDVPQLDDPTIEVSPTSGTAPLSVRLSVDNHDNGQVTIDWGDDTDTETVDGNNQDGDGPAEHPHQYTDVGEYTITVTATEDDRAQATTEVEVTDPAPAVDVEPTSGAAPLEVTLTADNHGNGPVDVNWGEGETETNLGDGEATSTHTYNEPGTYEVEVTSQEDSSHTTTVEVQVNDDTLDPQVSVDPTEGEAPLEVTATVDNHGNGPVNLDWGEGEAVEVADGEDATHTYEEAGEHTITATSQANEDAQGTATVTVTEPEPEPEDLELTADPTEGEAPLEVTATVNNHDQGPVNLDWGEGDPVEVEDGEDATHTYEEAGEHTITATDTDDDSRTATVTITVTEPEPEPEDLEMTVDPTEGTTDQTAFEVVVDNHGQGDVTLDWGDGSDTTTNPGDGEDVSTHTYAEAGEYTITATDADDDSRTTTQDVTVTDE